MTVGFSTALANGVANLFQREVSISRRNSRCHDFKLTVAVVIVLTSFSCASAAQPDEKPANTLQTENRERSIAFLKGIKRLAVEPPMTVTKVVATFGWPVAEEAKTPNGAIRTSFSPHPQLSWAYPSLTVSALKSERILRIQLSSELDPCLSGDDVLEQFGTTYKSSLVIMHPHPDTSTLSETVLGNLKKFFHGPIFLIRNGSVSTSINFNFSVSACAQGVTMTQTEQTQGPR